jgi:hypothetical protein
VWRRQRRGAEGRWPGDDGGLQADARAGGWAGKASGKSEGSGRRDKIDLRVVEWQAITAGRTILG